MNIASQADAASVVQGVFIAISICVAIAVYWLPVIVAYRRRLPAKSQVLVVTLFLGWTFVGWVIALVMALRELPPQRPVQYTWQPPR